MDRPAEIARIEGDLAFQGRVWRAERIAWIAMLALVGAALAGVFGAGGPLAGASTARGAVEVSWPRMQRLGRVAEIRIAGPAGALHLDPAFADGWRLHGTTPPGGAAGPGLRVLHVEPLSGPGPRRLRFAVGATAFDLPVFVWP
jgi:hypothetical protein